MIRSKSTCTASISDVVADIMPLNNSAESLQISFALAFSSITVRPCNLFKNFANFLHLSV